MPTSFSKEAASRASALLARTPLSSTPATYRGTWPATSAGAITAALIAAGYSADEISAVCIGLDLRQFEDKGWEDRFGGRGLSLLLDSGTYEGNRFRDWMRELLAT
jgi:hypothetical protein